MGSGCDYNIPSNNRELQRQEKREMNCTNYNIPSNNRELQHVERELRGIDDYNIPSNNRELQPCYIQGVLPFIITYQVITGNYNSRRNEGNSS